MNNRMVLILITITFCLSCGDDSGSKSECENDMDCSGELVCDSGECVGDVSSQSNNMENSNNSNNETSNNAINNEVSNNDPSNDEQTCEGRFSLGESIFTNSSSTIVGEACDEPLQPKNCPDGLFTTFFNDQCVCTPACSSYGLSVGDSCAADGSWTCQRVQGDSGDSATMCVANSWNLCLQE